MNTVNSEPNQSNTPLNYDDAMLILREAQRFLTSDCVGRPLVQRVSRYTQQAAEHAADKIARLQSERPDRVHALVLGEFKAGKSTLINALVGRPVAAVDVFEMTQAVCRIVPRKDGKEEVVLRSNNGQREKLVSLEEFLRMSQERKLADFTQADVYVSTSLDLILIDTPGLGATQKNEVQALDALASTDVVLYTVDAENMGGARDTALLSCIQESGLPFRCILTKADVLEDNQNGEAVAYLSHELAIDAAHIFSVSANRALLGHPEPGIDKLKRHLSDDIAPRSKGLREQAQWANLSDAAKELSTCVTAVETGIQPRLDEILKHQSVLHNMAQAVTDDLCEVAHKHLDEQLILEIEKPIIAALRSGKRFQDKDIADLMESTYSTERKQDFADALTLSLKDRFQQEWIKGVSANIDSLMSTVGILKQEADEDAAQALQQIIDHENFKKSATSTAIAGTVAGLAGTAVLGIGILGGIVVAGPFLYLAYEKWKKAGQGSSDEKEMKLRVSIIKWRESTIDSIIELSFRPELLKINLEVAEKSLDTFARNNQHWPLSLHELQQWRDRCDTVQAQLQHVRLTSYNALVKRL